MAMQQKATDEDTSEDYTNNHFRYYHDLELGVAASLGAFSADSEPGELLNIALAEIPPDETTPHGKPYSEEEREMLSLGALGAAEWTKQTKDIYPHALLNVTEFQTVDDWIRTLGRTCRRTLQKATEADGAGVFTVTALPIHETALRASAEIAPHSTLSHFRCILEHNLRLLDRHSPDWTQEDFVGMLMETMERFALTTQMSGIIYEYRNRNGDLVAFSHEVRKGSTVRGQWFYSTTEGSASYIWFHAVLGLVTRAIGSHKALIVDLGPNGNDGRLEAHGKLKSRYGFEMVEDWPSVADYRGPFW